MDADRPRALVGGERGDGGGGGVALARGRRGAFRAGQDAAQEPLAGRGDQQGVAEFAQLGRGGPGASGRARRPWRSRGPGRRRSGRGRCRRPERPPRVRAARRRLRRRRPRTSPCTLPPSRKPRQCMTTKGAPAAATAGIIAGSARPPLTSLTRTAPAASDCSATEARMVSTETVTPSEARPRTTGMTRLSSSVLVDAGGAGAGGLAADVHEVGALGDQVEAVLDGGRRVEPAAAVGEGIGGHVDDSHDRAAVPCRQSCDLAATALRSRSCLHTSRPRPLRRPCHRPAAADRAVQRPANRRTGRPSCGATPR